MARLQDICALHYPTGLLQYGCPLFVADELLDPLVASGWIPSVDLAPTLAPPFSEFWIETRWTLPGLSQKQYSGMAVSSVRNDDGTWDCTYVLFSGLPPDAKRQYGFDVNGGDVRLVNSPAVHMVGTLHLNDVGKCTSEVIHRYVTIPDLDGLDRDDNKLVNAQFFHWMAFSVALLWCGVGFIHRSKTKLVTTNPHDQEKKRWRKIFDRPLLKYQLLTLPGPRETWHTGSRPRDRGVALHVRHGHWKQFPQGALWWEAHHVGDARYGVMLHDYKLGKGRRLG